MILMKLLKTLSSLRYKDWKRAKKEIGLPIQVKDLRSTLATRMRAHDIHLYDEKDCLGHIVKDVTRRYAQAGLKLVTILNRIFLQIRDKLI